MNKKVVSIKTKRMLIKPTSDHEIEEMIESMDSDELRTAYGEMLSGCKRDPENRIWYAPWRMILKDNNTYIGDLCFKGPVHENAVEIGYGVLPEYEGKGYTTEAVQAMTQWAFSNDGVMFVEAETEAENKASQRILEKCGFTPDGIGKEGPRFILKSSLSNGLRKSGGTVSSGMGATKRIAAWLLVLPAVFILLNLIWFGWRHMAYSGFAEGMSHTDMSSPLFPTYAAKDEDGFDYTVKYLDYLSLTGNLAVGFPGTEENPITDGLIIWPQCMGGYEYGVMLNSREEDGSGYMFYVDAQGNAVDESYQSIAEEYRKVILELMERAENAWSLD